MKLLLRLDDKQDQGMNQQKEIYAPCARHLFKRQEK